MLREKYLPAIRDEREENIKAKVSGKQVAVLCDETTDKRGSCVFVILFKIIEASDSIETIVADVHTLQTADAKNCTRAILDTLKKFDVSFDNVLALASDSARYMVKCFDTLKNIMADHVVVVQCWAHKLNLIMNVLGKQLPELQNATSKVKLAFLNTRKRKHLYKQFLDEKYPGMNTPLFPIPVLTRWSSWYESVAYIADYFLDIIEFMRMDEIASVSNSGIEFLTQATKDHIQIVKIQAVFVKETGRELVDLVRLLEGSTYPFSHVVHGKLRKLEHTLQLAEAGSFGESTKANLMTCEKDVLKAQVTSVLVTASSHASTKLLSLKSNDPAHNFYKELSVFDPAEIIQTNISPQLGKRLKNIFLLSHLDENLLLQGYTELQFAVKKHVHEEDSANIVSILMGLSLNHPEFSKGVLKSIWLPCANADSERFFSKYNTVLSDRRHGLTQENLQLLSEMCFEA